MESKKTIAKKSIVTAKQTKVAPVVKFAAPPLPKSKSGKEEEVVLLPNVRSSKEKNDRRDKKIAKSLKRLGGDKFMKLGDPWLCGVTDPFHIHGVKIPDLITNPSATFTIWDHRTIQATSNGVAAVAWGISQFNSPTTEATGSLVPVDTTTALANYVVGCTNFSNASNALVYYGIGLGLNATSITLPQWNSDTSSVRNLFSHARLVSMGSRMVCTSNALNAQGVITAVSAQRSWLRNVRWNAGVGVSLQDLQSHPKAEIVSIPKYFGAMAVWTPLDLTTFDYTDLSETYVLANGLPDSATAGEIYLCASGCSTGQTFQVDTCWNFEAIPQTSQLDIVSASVSKSDPVSFSNTMNKLPDVDSVVPLAPTKGTSATAAPDYEDLTNHSKDLVSQPHPMQETSMLEKIMDGVGGFATKATDIVKDISPILESIL